MAELPMFAVLFDAYRRFYGQPCDIERAGRFLRERLGRGQSLLFGAWRGGELCGFCHIYPGHSSVAAAAVWVLNDLFVQPQFRRQGVANALMAACEAGAQAAGIGRMQLETALDNQSAQALYARRGWRRATGFVSYEWVPD
jgi:ribosomal protein S18 acetylase RimI-like enzyme